MIAQCEQCYWEYMVDHALACEARAAHHADTTGHEVTVR
jgi:hypothetical protein